MAYRKALTMKIFEGRAEEYKKRHDELWPEMKAMLLDHGITTYSIYLDEKTGILFAYLEYESQELHDSISSEPICRKWWDYMKDIMETNEDHSPISFDLREVFHIEK
ncbi:L-rhamnose mutarotase [Gorillibacterium sp. sgz5001074]|uniref:L-rhamnose mutarotase n=1 Tax=Gorillibacterium sp. sgz5001074 TaxID=3446695 RepID=UPI003F66459F